MTCVPAPTCRAALREASRLYPGRSTASDGICASASHTSQNPNSAHEVGNAHDLTHNPTWGCDAHALADLVVARRDPRIRLVISNRRIARSYAKPGIPAWTWSTYTGSNPHDKHAHFEIHANARNSTAPWWHTANAPHPLPAAPQATRHTLGGIPVARIPIIVPCDSAGEGSAPVLDGAGAAVPYGRVLALTSQGVLDKYDGDTKDTTTLVARVGLRDSGEGRITVAGGPPRGSVVVVALVAD